MLLVRDVIDTLKNGELATVFTEFPLEENYSKFFINLNNALTYLCNRFSIIEKQLTLRRYAHIAHYKLEKRFARTSGSTEPYKYILDTEEDPFKEDVIQIEKAYDEFGRQVPLNDAVNPHSWFTSNNLIQIPNTRFTGEIAFFVYRAYHPRVHELNDQLLVPEILLDAICSYIAYKVHTTRTDQESVALANNFYQKFEDQCLAFEQDNSLSTSHTNTNIKPRLGGWV